MVLLLLLFLELQLFKLSDDFVRFELKDLLVLLEVVILLGELLLEEVSFVEEEVIFLFGLVLQLANLRPQCVCLRGSLGQSLSCGFQPLLLLFQLR